MSTANVKAFGTNAKDAPLEPMNIQRREVMPKDVEIEILYCGVCHSDLHTTATIGVARFTRQFPAMKLSAA